MAIYPPDFNAFILSTISTYVNSNYKGEEKTKGEKQERNVNSYQVMDNGCLYFEEDELPLLPVINLRPGGVSDSL